MLELILFSCKCLIFFQSPHAIKKNSWNNSLEPYGWNDVKKSKEWKFSFSLLFMSYHIKKESEKIA